MMKKKYVTGAIAAIVFLLLIAAGSCFYIFEQIARKPFITEEQWVYIYPDKHTEGMPEGNAWFDMAAQREQLYQKMEEGKLTGAYRLEKGWSVMQTVRCLARHQQTAVKLTFIGARTLNDIAGKMARCVAADSLSIVDAMLAPAFVAECNSDSANIGAFFLPDTYHVYWDIAPEKLVERLKKEHDKYWTSERLEKCKALNITPQQAYILCSIAEEETANRAERGVVARLYWNRLQKGMRLQADPTVKFAVGDFSLKRILIRHLAVESPYNTYQVAGLPPGPIRVVEKATIDAFLNSQPHPYLFMCAKEDFSGLHNFATTNAEHEQNARKYHEALNKLKIK